MTDVTQLIDKLTQAASFKFKEDGTSPGVTISKLRRGYYCSVVRYAKTGSSSSQKKVVVCKAESDTLEGAVKGAADEFLRVVNTAPDPLQELSNFVSKK